MSQTATAAGPNTQEREYAIADPIKLATFFKDEKIPSSFPKYDQQLSMKENKLQIVEWGQIEENRQLLKEEYLLKFDKKVEEYNNRKK